MVYENGAVVYCPGLFSGELVMMIESSRRSILMVMNATDPDMAYVILVFNELVRNSFTQCISCFVISTIPFFDPF